MKRILIVEDDLDIRESIVDMLHLHHFDTQTASDGRQALAKALAWHPDLIITDIMMPNMDGYQLLHALRQSIECRHTPVLVLSAKVQQSDIERGMFEGASDYIVKPFRMDDLLRAVKRHI